jgi:hypothetical protein
VSGSRGARPWRFRRRWLDREPTRVDGSSRARPPCNTLGVEQGHASNLPSKTDASRVHMVRRRIRHRSSPGPSSPVLQPCLSPTRHEHRHGFEHQRTVRPLPAQVSGDSWSGSGYERGGFISPMGRAHALRTSVRPEGRRRETLCGVLASAVNGQHFTPMHPRACRTCTSVADSNPLRYGISASNELSRLRSLLDDVGERRVDPADALSWIRANSP